MAPSDFLNYLRANPTPAAMPPNDEAQRRSEELVALRGVLGDTKACQIAHEEAEQEDLADLEAARHDHEQRRGYLLHDVGSTAARQGIRKSVSNIRRSRKENFRRGTQLLASQDDDMADDATPKALPPAALPKAKSKTPVLKSMDKSKGEHRAPAPTAPWAGFNQKSAIQEANAKAAKKANGPAPSPATTTTTKAPEPSEFGGNPEVTAGCQAFWTGQACNGDCNQSHDFPFQVRYLWELNRQNFPSGSLQEKASVLVMNGTHRWPASVLADMARPPLRRQNRGEPCKFFWSRGSCKNGRNCAHGHVTFEEESYKDLALLYSQGNLSRLAEKTLEDRCKLEGWTDNLKALRNSKDVRLRMSRQPSPPPPLSAKQQRANAMLQNQLDLNRRAKARGCPQ
ncbi:hypothetical protein M409DRAFT_25529 [Zasmidium cellare ATCC 36951]|uniref:C3H1-type domain-containing protein n=1 Tax=Zasmidium cellare ATCC 36951 TaxID=1080233 RepID=A0A6A6CAJ4_ZASCE|nr:uncharacterized protein M409DRAFT_25529 [Zasmidium cellare ATCC 36951]KAF2164184.1 hypothetical protein M409DRAFT_25529 [Zasmidium cellare ATCC 36951]